MGNAPVPPSYNHERPDVCPGYLVQLPQVVDAARSYSWRKDGALSEYTGGKPLTELHKYAIDIYASSQREVENYRIRKAQEGDGS